MSQGLMRDRKSSFPKIEWSEVLRACGEGAEASAALSTLLEVSVPALRSFLMRRWKLPAERAGDLVQGFVADRVLRDGLLRQADPSRGEFGGFLVRALERYVIDERRKERAAKRLPGQAVSLDDPVIGETPQKAARDPFEVQWAKRTLERALERMRGECVASGRLQMWELFELRVLRPILEHVAPVKYQELRERFRFESPEQASNLLITAKRMFGRSLRSVVSEGVDGETEVEEEIARLKHLLAKD